MGLRILVALALLSGCVEGTENGLEPALVEEDVEPGLAADGNPPPWNGDGDPPWAGDEPGEPESSVHPVRGRIELAISASGGLRPNAPVTLTVSGEAVERIDSGEVVLTLPTKALMDHVGEGRPDLPVKARWPLPSMVAGDMWSGTYAVPGEAAGYYRAMANAYTHGPDSGLFLFDDVVRSAWMHIHETDGQLTRWFEDSIFPEGVHPVAGPALADSAMYSRPSGTTWHRDSVYLDVVYAVSQTDSFKPAVGARIRGYWDRFPGVPGGGTESRVVTVPEDGIVSFWCRTPSGHVRGYGYAPDTRLVQGRTNITSWITSERHCGQLVQVEVKAHEYLPWRLLNLAADTLQKHFGHTRGRIKWKTSSLFGANYYNPVFDKITLVWGQARFPRFHWTVAHEYGHALHHKALGGMWWKRSSLTGCLLHTIDRLESYKCALQEGFANYAGTIGSGGYREQCFEHLGTSEGRDVESWCRDISHDRKPESEAWVAALFLDLTDDREEEGDYTEYPGLYVAEVFKTCKVRNWHPMPWPLPDVYLWRKRTNVSNIVWCLERLVTPGVHVKAFPRTPTPVDVEEKATEPLDWRFSDIRLTWLKNLTNGLVTRTRE